MIVHLDFETRSRTDLKRVGVERYAADPSTEITAICWALDEDPIKAWQIGDPDPDVLINLAAWRHLRSIRFAAHNAAFERWVWQKICHERHGWPEITLERWHCTAAMAAARSLPRALGTAAKALGLPVEKDWDGRRLMLKMSKPIKK